MLFLTCSLLGEEGLIPSVFGSVVTDEVVGDVEGQPDTPSERDPECGLGFTRWAARSSGVL